MAPDQPKVKPRADKVKVPDVIGHPAGMAGGEIENSKLVPAYVDQDGHAIAEPNPEWYVQHNGEQPNRGEEVDVGTTVHLTIAATFTGR